MNFQSGLTISIYILIMLLLGFIEYLLLATFTPNYMRMGLPVYRRRLAPVSKKQFIQLWQRLIAENNRNLWYPNLVFKRISNNEIAFRNHFLSLDFGLANNKPFRGIMHYEPETQSIILSGKLTYFEPFYLVGVIWYMWYFIQKFELVTRDLSLFSSQSDNLLFLAQILFLIRVFLAISHHKFGQRLEKLLSNQIT